MPLEQPHEPAVRWVHAHSTLAGYASDEPFDEVCRLVFARAFGVQRTIRPCTSFFDDVAELPTNAYIRVSLWLRC